VRENRGGKLYSLVYGKIVAEHIDPIEKKPLFNFLQGSRAFSIGTVKEILVPISEYPTISEEATLHEAILVLKRGREEFVEQDAPLDEAIHQLIMGNHHNLLVTRNQEIVWILRLRDMSNEIYRRTKACET
jgi:hypothetical protein